MKVLCFGSLNIDYTYSVDHFVMKGETLFANDLKNYCGGKGLNQATSLAKAGLDTYMAGAIGKEGAFLVEELNKFNVNTDYVKVLDTINSGHAIIQNDKSGDNCIMVYHGANYEITNEQVDEVLSNFNENDVMVLQNEINNMAYIITEAHKKGIYIVLNPSPLTEELLAYPLDLVDLFVVNEVEAAQLLQSNENPVMLIPQLQKRLNTCVLTLGEKGSVFISKEDIIYQDAYKVDTVDTTGAGDTFMGYFLAYFLNHKSVREALEIASKASAIAVTRKGASVAIPYKEEVENTTL